MKMLRPAFTLFALLTGITGLIYPLAMTGIARVVFPRQAAGSLILRDGRVLGSELIGQHTEDPKYFWGRLSATGDFPTNASNSGASNFAPSNPELRKAAKRRVQALWAADPENTAPVPVDLVTASASGLDPHISPAAARYQIHRIAKLRGMDEDALRAWVHKETEPRFLGIFGEPKVNVLKLNLAMDGMKP